MTRFLLLAVLLIAVPAAAQTPAAPGPPPAPRTFTAPVGLLFNTVRPDRVADFEKVVGFLEAALQKSSDAKDRAQAQGWRIFRAAEPGPGNTVLYVFILDPAVPGVDYGLGRILAEAYDTTQLQEIVADTGAVTSGGTLLNLTLVKPGATTTPSSTASPASPPTDRALPPDADPNRR